MSRSKELVTLGVTPEYPLQRQPGRDQHPVQPLAESHHSLCVSGRRCRRHLRHHQQIEDRDGLAQGEGQQSLVRSGQLAIKHLSTDPAVFP